MGPVVDIRLKFVDLPFEVQGEIWAGPSGHPPFEIQNGRGYLLNCVLNPHMAIFEDGASEKVIKIK